MNKKISQWFMVIPVIIIAIVAIIIYREGQSALDAAEGVKKMAGSNVEEEIEPYFSGFINIDVGMTSKEVFENIDKSKCTLTADYTNANIYHTQTYECVDLNGQAYLVFLNDVLQSKISY